MILSTADVFAVANLWDGRSWLGPSIVGQDRQGFRRLGAVGDVPAGNQTPTIPVSVLPGFRDSHVHLGLVDPVRLLGGGVARVVDLGWTPRVSRGWQLRSRVDFDLPLVTHVGAFLTAPGGYPSDRSWAPKDSVRIVQSTADGADAVASMVRSGATGIKVTLNSTAGPTLDTDTLFAICRTAARHRIPVIAHAEGTGQAQRARMAGVSVLAHTPWSERLSDDEILAQAMQCQWISTLDIHGHGPSSADLDVASDNARRFCASGGQMVYGSDLGNGPLPTGINVRELRHLIRIGLDIAGVLRAVCPVGDTLGMTRSGPRGPSAHGLGSRLTVVAGDPPSTAEQLPDWLLNSSVATTTRLTQEMP